MKATFRAAPALQRLARGAIYSLLEAGPTPSSLSPALLKKARARGAPLPRVAGEGPRPARQAHPELPNGVQANPPLQRLLRRPPARERRARHGGDRSDYSGRSAHQRWERAPARRARLRHRVPRRGGGGTVRNSRARRARLERGVEERCRGLPGNDGRRLPEPVPPRRAEHGARTQLHDLHDRVAGHSTYSTRSAP